MRQWTVDAFAAAPFKGNPACVLIARSLIMLTEQQTAPTKTRRTAANHVHRVHEKVGRAIIDGDAESARTLMTKHIQALDPWLGEALYAKAT